MNTKKYILLSILCILIHNMFGQAIGSWKAYPALQIATKNIPVDNKIYSLCEGNLFSYDIQTTEVYVYDRINSLHDNDIHSMEYCNSEKKLMLIYTNGNIDLIYPNNEVVNLKQLKDKNYPTLSINNLSITDHIAYISTNFGIISVDLQKEIFINTYDLGKNVQSCITDDSFIYASTSEGFYKGDLKKNLLDKSNWEYISNFTFDKIIFFQNELFCIRKNEGLFQLNKQTLQYTKLASGNFNYLTAHDNIMLTGNESNTYIYTSPSEFQAVSQTNRFNYLIYQNGIYWASQKLQGLQPYTLEEGYWKASQSPIQPNSPVRDYFCWMSYHDNRLLVAGGNLNYSLINYEGTVMCYENDTWHNFNEENITTQTKLKYINVTSVAQDPNDPTHHFVSTARHGLYEFKDFNFIKKYDYTNSSLNTILPNSSNPLNYVSCSGLTYDSHGNLWMLNNEVDTIFKIFKPDQTWVRLYYPEIAGSTACDAIYIDHNENIWMISRRLSQAGLFFLDYNGTLDEQSDDRYILRKEVTNQDGVKYDPENFYCITKDHDGHLWVGTNIGPFVITDPENFMNDDFTYTQIKIPRNDGTNYADYLLNGVSITTIAVDAANRKWLGTSDNGIYLISADGQEMLQHFTTENSPLLSDNIQSMAVDPQTGEVMIGTTNGLVSYMSDATPSQNELNKDQVYAFPNPVKPDYNGVISITGLTDNAEVKITSVTGQLVYSGHSNGGLFTWDGRNGSGKRVSSGIYQVIASTQDGKKAVVTRITFIR